MDAVAEIALDGERAFVLSRRTDDGVSVGLVRGDSSWSGLARCASFASFAARLGVAVERYEAATLATLSAGAADEAVSFSFAEGRLAWRRRVDEGVFVAHGDVELEGPEPGGAARLFDAVERLRVALASACAEARAEAAATRGSLSSCCRALTQAVDAKRRSEAELYARFLALLNAKKLRIAELTEFVESADDGEIAAAHDCDKISDSD